MKYFNHCFFGILQKLKMKSHKESFNHQLECNWGILSLLTRKHCIIVKWTSILQTKIILCSETKGKRSVFKIISNIKRRKVFSKNISNMKKRQVFSKTILNTRNKKATWSTATIETSDGSSRCCGRDHSENGQGSHLLL